MRSHALAPPRLDTFLKVSFTYDYIWATVAREKRKKKSLKRRFVLIAYRSSVVTCLFITISVPRMPRHMGNKSFRFILLAKYKNKNKKAFF